MKSNQLKTTALVAVAFLSGSVFTGVAQAQHEQHGDQHKAPAAKDHTAGMQAGAKQLHDMMMASHKSMMNHMPMEKDTDRMFATMMAKHHEDGIKMAEIEVKHGNDAKAKAMANKIIKAQTAERKQLLAIAKSAK